MWLFALFKGRHHALCRKEFYQEKISCTAGPLEAFSGRFMSELVDECNIHIRKKAKIDRELQLPLLKNMIL